MNRAAILAIAAAFSGCVEDDLSTCINSTESTVLLRQLALTENARTDFERCRIDTFLNRADVSREDWCKALYLNANAPVRLCMQNKGYTWLGVDWDGPVKCDWSQYQQPACYESKWLAYGEKFLAHK